MVHPRTAGQESIRKINKSVVLNTLRLYGSLSRADLASRTGLNRSTVTNIVNYLIDEGFVSEGEQINSKIGRPGIALALKPGGGAVIGLEIGVDFVDILLTDFVAHPLWQQRCSVSPDLAQIEVISQAEKLIDQALAIASAQGLRPLGIGVGLPGLVNTHQGKLVFAPNLGWRDVPLRLMWNQRFHLPLFIDNESNLAALGEYYFGIGQGVENLIFLNADIGLGAGILIDGNLFKGSSGYAGEIGHIQRDPNGDLCGCGRRGCWETQVGPRAVLRRVRTALQTTPGESLARECNGDFSKLTFANIVEAAHRGDPVCRQALEEVAVNLGRGIADLANIFNPQLVVIGGALVLAGDILLPVINSTVPAEALQAVHQNLRVDFSGLGTEACAYGAIAIVLDDILREMAIV